MGKDYELTYFNIAGRAEAVRLMFKVAGVEFTDHQLTFAEWAASKADSARFPLNQLPTLKVDGRTMCQSGAIYRYVANELGFYGANNEDRSVIDQIVETLNEQFGEVVKIIMSPNLNKDEKKEKMDELYGGEFSKNRFRFVSDILKSKNSGKSFFIGEKISLADFVFIGMHDMLKFQNYTDYLKPYPELQALVERIYSVDVIKKHQTDRKY